VRCSTDDVKKRSELIFSGDGVCHNA
jgi:hypothetical protein